MGNWVHWFGVWDLVESIWMVWSFESHTGTRADEQNGSQHQRYQTCLRRFRDTRSLVRLTSAHLLSS
jgi:hypothetical protein